MCDNAYGWGDSDAYWILGCVSQFPEQAEAWDDLPISKIDVLQDIRAICIRSKSGSVSIRTDGSVWYAGSWTGSDPLPVLGYDSQLFVQVQQAMTFNAECVVDGYAFDEPTSYRNDVIYMLREDGTLWHSFFDIHAYYQMLSSHDYASRLFTVPVYDGIDGVVQISGTVKYDLLMMYALRRDGSVWFRGYDVYGRAGLGNDAGDQVIAVNRWTRLPGLANIISIAVDDDGGFAIDSSGDVWGWGANTRYDRDGEAISTRFGMITASNQSALPYGGGYGVEYAAVKIPLSTVRQVVGFGGGLPGAIYLLEDGTVWAAGICPNGTYYPEEMDDDDYAAQQQAALNIICVPYIKDVASLAAALFTVIALKDGGTVYGWGMYPVQYLGIPDGYVWTSPKTGASYVYSSGDTLYYPTPVPIAQPIKQLANTSTRIVSDISNILADPDGTRCIYGFIRLRIRASVYGMSEIYEPTTTDSYVYAGVRSPTKNYPANLLHKISVSGLSKWAYGRLAEYGVENTAVMPNGQIYATSWGKADKLTPHGQLIWRIVLDPEPSSYATDVAIAPDGSTRISQRKYEESAVHAVNSDGVTLWQCDVDVTGRIATDRYGCTYVTLSDGKICRITALGDIEWTAVASQTSSSCIGVAVDPNGYVYAGTSNGYYAKLDLAGARIWSRWISSGYPIKALAVDVEGRLYYGANVSVIKASTAGDTVWSYDGHQYDVDSIAVGPDGAVYSGGQSLHKTDASGQLIWEYDAGHTTVYQDSGSSFKCTAIDPGCVGAFPEEYGFDV